MNTSSKYLWPVAAIVIGGAAAWLAQSSPTTKTSAYAAVTADPAGMRARAGMQTPGVHGDSQPESTGDSIQGKVLETITVPNYTYLRIDAALPGGEKPKDGVWAAVATADVKVGQAVTIVGANRMDKFSSSTLKRTFDVIFFGALAGPGEAQSSQGPQGQAMMQGQAPANLPPGHPDISGNSMPGSMPGAAPVPSGDNPHGAMGASGADPHGSPSSGGDSVPIGKVARAAGKLGHTVAEVVNERKGLSGKKVRVRGVVVKSTSGVLGKTFVHLRDGSGNAKSGDHDLTVTTEQAAAIGSTLLFEGTVVTDKDFGAGYSYPVLVEDAQTVTE